MSHRSLAARSTRAILQSMSTLAEVEAAIPGLNARELDELEQLVRKVRHEKEQSPRPSLLDTKPARVGKILRPLGARHEWQDEMLEGRA